MTISTKYTNTLAKKVKAYVDKKHKLPKRAKAGGVKYTYPQIAYILAQAVVDPKKEAAVKKVKKATDNSGDNVEVVIKEDDYKTLAKKLVKFVDENSRLPNYITYNKKQIKQRVFIYAFAKIIVYYNEKKKMPATCGFKTSETVKKSVGKTSSNGLHSYLTSQGCSGMGQCTGYYCGCNSLQQCFYRLTGILVSESTIASVAGTTTSGTDHEGLNTAVKWFNNKYNQNIQITWKNFSDLGNSSSARWSALQSYIDKGAVFCHILYRNQWGHYEVPKAVNSDTLSILNSLGDKCGSASYCGYIETRSKSAQSSYMSGISQKSIAILTKG